MNTQSPITPATETTMANAIRALTMDAVQAANSGHPGMPMGMADVAAVLFNRFIRIDPAVPGWPGCICTTWAGSASGRRMRSIAS